MSITATACATHWIAAALLVLGCHAPDAIAQSTPTTTLTASTLERLHDNALASFRRARFSEAYGRLIALADRGHARSAEMALWMYLHGPSVFATDWDSSPEQLTAWAQLAGQPAPTMSARIYPRIVNPVLTRVRSTAP